jgi:hypothetical protein
VHCILQEQAYSHKYPQRPRHEWGHKLQQYRPPGSSSTVGVSLRDMVRGKAISTAGRYAIMQMTTVVLLDMCGMI